jgi:hypothetical protein
MSKLTADEFFKLPNAKRPDRKQVLLESINSGASLEIYLSGNKETSMIFPKSKNMNSIRQIQSLKTGDKTTFASIRLTGIDGKQYKISDIKKSSQFGGSGGASGSGNAGGAGNESDDFGTTAGGGGGNSAGGAPYYTGGGGGAGTSYTITGGSSYYFSPGGNGQGSTSGTPSSYGGGGNGRVASFNSAGQAGAQGRVVFYAY